MKERITLLVGVVVLELERTVDESGATGYVAEVSQAVAIAATYYPARREWRVAVFTPTPTGARVVAHQRAHCPQAAASQLSGEAIEAVQLARAA